MKALIILLFPVMLYSQSWYEWGSSVVECRSDLHMESVLDSIEIAVIPANAQVIGVYGIVDTAITDRVKIGLSGDDTSKPRFGWLNSFTPGTIAYFNPYQTIETTQGVFYFYGTDTTGIAVTCERANFPYAIHSYSGTTENTMQFSGDSIVTMRAHEDGLYTISAFVSFRANKAATGHCELFVNGTEVQNYVFNRTIGVSTQFGSASFQSRSRLQEGDEVKIVIESSVANTVFNIEHMQFNLFKVPKFEPYYTQTQKSVMLYTGTATGQIRLYVLYRLL